MLLFASGSSISLNNTSVWSNTEANKSIPNAPIPASCDLNHRVLNCIKKRTSMITGNKSKTNKLNNHPKNRLETAKAKFTENNKIDQSHEKEAKINKNEEDARI